MIDKSKLKVGDKVRYQSPKLRGTERFEPGIVKDLSEIDNAVFVVYNCGTNWHKWEEYTGSLTQLEDLYLGWELPEADF